MENYSVLDIMANDVGIPADDKSQIEYLKDMVISGDIKFGNKSQLLIAVDKSGSKLMSSLENGFKEVSCGYNTEYTIEVKVSEYLKNVYDQNFGAIVIEDKNSEMFNLCAELDCYDEIERFELPVTAKLKIYAMAINVHVFKDKSEFDETINMNPLAKTKEGKDVKFGTTFLTPTGIMPGNEDTFFPSLTYVISKVNKVEKKINTVSKKEFFVLNCKGVFGDFELLCRPESINTEVKKGSVVTGFVVFRVEVADKQK